MQKTSVTRKRMLKRLYFFQKSRRNAGRYAMDKTFEGDNNAAVAATLDTQKRAYGSGKNSLRDPYTLALAQIDRIRAEIEQTVIAGTGLLERIERGLVGTHKEQIVNGGHQATHLFASFFEILVTHGYENGNAQGIEMFFNDHLATIGYPQGKPANGFSVLKIHLKST